MPSKSQAKAAVKRKVDESEDAARSNSIGNLEMQGRFWRQGCESGAALDYWSKAVWALPSHIIQYGQKFWREDILADC